MIRVLIADDHTIVRKGLREMIDRIPHMTVKAEAGDGCEVLEKISQEDFDLVVLDLSMPGMSGLDALKQIKNIKSGLPVLVLSMHAEIEYVMRVIKAGASGYLTKACAVDELEKALMKVAAGGRYISPSLSEAITFALGDEKKTCTHQDLSDREFQIMCLIASGKSTTEIASDLAISTSTVSTYRARITEKMNFASNADLIRYVLDNNLIE